MPMSRLARLLTARPTIAHTNDIPNHGVGRFSCINRRPAQSSEARIVDDTGIDTRPNVDIVILRTSAPKTGTRAHGSSDLRLHSIGSRTQLGGATGATVETRRKRKSAMSFHAQDRHKRAGRILGDALTIDDPRTWTAAGAVLVLHLSGWNGSR